MKIVFLTEMPFKGKIPATHSNMRTEFAWMHALDADHNNIHDYNQIVEYDHVFIIFPKGKLSLSADGSKIATIDNPSSTLLNSDLIQTLKTNNKKVYYIQEGPVWWFNDYDIADQINFYNLLGSVDGIFAHNEYDTKFYKGLIPNADVNVIPTLLIEELLQEINSVKTDKVMIGGNFCHWYGGFQSYIVANEFNLPIWAQASHAKRAQEGELPNIHHLNRLTWIDWMTALSEFKYAIHLMPTRAAGTFALNCAYFGIPCIGYERLDTQQKCHPSLTIKVEDTESARKLAKRLANDSRFYDKCSREAKNNYRKHYDINIWNEKLNKLL